MITYIFTTTFFLIFILSFFTMENMRYPSLIMFIGYVLYIFFILPIVYKIIHPVDPYDAGRLYFILLCVLDTSIGLLILNIFKKTKDTQILIVGCLLLFSALNHIYGRIGYQYYWDNSIYHYTSIMVTVSIIIIMTWPIINGFYNKVLTVFNGRWNLRLTNNYNKKCISKIKVQKVEG